MDAEDGRIVSYTCPRCGAKLARQELAFTCEQCGDTVPIVDGIPHFPLQEAASHGSDVFDLLASIYESPLWFPAIYRILAGPGAPTDDRRQMVRDLDWTAETVLDVACGTGRVTRMIAPAAKSVYGIDRSHRMLREAARTAHQAGLENVRFARMDAMALQFDDETFDGVTCGWALHLFDDVPTALGEIARVLSSGGWFAGATIRDAWVAGLPGVGRLMQQTVGGKPFAPSSFRAHLEAADLELTRLDGVGAALFFGARKR